MQVGFQMKVGIRSVKYGHPLSFICNFTGSMIKGKPNE